MAAKGKHVSFRLSADEHERFKAVSSKLDLPVSHLLRAGAQMYIRYLEQQDDVLVSQVQQEEKRERYGKPDTN